MADTSIFDLLQPVQTPQENDLRKWLGHTFPYATEQTAFQLAIQLERLFEMAVFENQIDDVHMLLQQGIPPNLRFDWGLTPLMWTNCLNYDEISDLLLMYGANPSLKSFSGIKAANFKNLNRKQNSIEYKAILKRRAEIHEMVRAKYLKPLADISATNEKTYYKKPAKKSQRQIDNGTGVDEILKKLSKSYKA